MTSSKPRLFGARGGGSAIIEAVFTLAGLDYDIDYVDWDALHDPEGRLAAINPLREIPTLQLPGGRLLTESAAICLWAGDQAPASGLVPAPGDAQRAVFLNRLVWFVANIYPTFTFADHPERFLPAEDGAAQLRAAMEARRQMLWRQLEAETIGTPWLLGERLTALDIYVSVMTRWRPKRAWFKDNCPALHVVATRVDDIAALAPIWQENFS